MEVKRNPCRNCPSAFHDDAVGRHISKFGEPCWSCEKIRSYKKYLESKRKYKAGSVITSFEELLEQTWVMWFGRTRHVEVLKSMPVRTVENFIKRGALQKAIRKNDEGGEFSDREDGAEVQNQN